MGFGSQSGQVILGVQSAPGVTRTDLATKGTALKLTSGSLAGNRELLTPDPEIGGSRSITDANLGPVSFSGDYEMYVRFRSAALLLYGALGVVDSDAVTGAPADTAFEHVITATPNSQLPFFTIYEEISNDLERFLYTDAVVNSFSLEVDAGGYLTATAGMLARLMTAGATNIDGTSLIDNTSMVVGTNVFLKYNGVSVPAKSFGLSIVNNVEDDDHRLGSFFLGDMTAKSLEVTGSMTLRHDSAARMRQALFGSASATQIGGLTTKQGLQITMESYVDIPGATGTKWSIDINCPFTILNPFAFEPSGDDVLENDIEMTMVQNDPAQSIITATVRNDVEDLLAA
ncbi:major tail protein [Gordonia phage Jumbo]|uniref:Major tail protein n=1 Tax=Gordonia phage Jumbo TaxID=1887650 RepID=A0A1B3B0L1_9CAUD|nr:major tail protein [Gordonia phage Jumbo]AOE44531.1 major tail protein [Gordonia phage Jumbo]